MTGCSVILSMYADAMRRLIAAMLAIGISIGSACGAGNRAGTAPPAGPAVTSTSSVQLSCVPPPGYVGCAGNAGRSPQS